MKVSAEVEIACSLALREAVTRRHDVMAVEHLLFALLQIGRLWVLATLGERWTTRIMVLPGAPLVTRGPYRFVDHPNYIVVVLEIAVLPLVFGLWQIAVIFSLLNAAVLTIRIGAENRLRIRLAEAHALPLGSQV